MQPDAFFTVTGREMEALAGLSDRAFRLYLLLKAMADHQTGVVGLRSKISLYGLCRELEEVTPKGRGTQVERPSEKQVITAIEWLKKRGLVVRRATDLLVFFLPMYRRASARPNQTGHIQGTHLSTEQVTHESSNGVGFDAIHGTVESDCETPNRAHINEVRMYTPLSSSTDLTGVDACAAGVNRDRPAASQAGSACCRSGNGNETSNRDRATPSHPAHARRSGGHAQPDGAPPPACQNEAPVGSAIKDSSGDGADASPAPEVLELRSLLKQRGIFVGAGDVPYLVEWAEAGVTGAEVEKAIDIAVKYRVARDSMDPIPVLYLAKTVKTQRAKARGKVGTPLPHSAIEARARAVGMWPAPHGMGWEKLAEVVAPKWAALQGARNG